MDNKKELGQRINTALALRDKKQKELARAIGVTDNTISYFCGGKRTPNLQQIIAIAKELNVSTDYLLGLSATPSIDEDIQAACKTTGLKETTIEKFVFMRRYNPPEFDVLDCLIEKLSLRLLQDIHNLTVIECLLNSAYNSGRDIHICDKIISEYDDRKDAREYRAVERFKESLKDVVRELSSCKLYQEGGAAFFKKEYLERTESDGEH